ncbi:MAG: T9SS type A sorting domain-containing protein, partial [Fibrobacterota bacterium]
DYNAGMVGGVAFLKALENPGGIQVSQDFSATPSGGIDFITQTVTFSAGFSSQSVPWTIVIRGGSGATKRLTGTGDINVEWDGTADDGGRFLSGETVTATLDVEGQIAVMDLLKVRSRSIFIERAKGLDPRPDDVLIDDFEDGNTTNSFGGEWLALGTETGFMTRTSISSFEGDYSQVLRVKGQSGSSGQAEYMGVRSTFNSDGSAVSIGNPVSIMFDLNASAPARVHVELEQPSISDGAYYTAVVTATENVNTYRLEIADFSQPDWKTADTPLDLNDISSIRFMVYDATDGQINLNLDNLFVENISLGVASPVSMPNRLLPKPVFSNGLLVYNLPESMTGNLNLSVYNLAGKQVLNKVLTAQRGKRTTVSLSQLPHGVYTVVHSSEGKMIGDKMMITHVK